MPTRGLSLMGAAARLAIVQRMNSKPYLSAADARAIAENKRHNVMNGCKNQVRATYGEDSDEVASMGLKKKSEKKTGGGRGKKGKEAE